MSHKITLLLQRNVHLAIRQGTFNPPRSLKVAVSVRGVLFFPPPSSISTRLLHLRLASWCDKDEAIKDLSVRTNK